MLLACFWGWGIIFTICGFAVQPRSQAPLFFLAGIGCLIVAIPWTYHRIKAPEREREAKRAQKLEEQRNRERNEKQLAHMEGLAKFHKIDCTEAYEYNEGIKAARQLGIIMQQSVYQEKEKDWAVLGGIADGIAGPFAGIATAANTMQKNEKIRAENAARREWGARQNSIFQDLANQAEKKKPVSLSMSQLQNKYEVVLSWAPSTLFEKIQLSCTKVSVDELTGAVIVSASWRQIIDRSICIDGSFRAKIYSNDGKCAGCAYLSLPKTGTAKGSGGFDGICACPKPATEYTVKFEPLDLWELTLKGNSSYRKTDNLTDEEHRKIVSDSEAKFAREVGYQEVADELKKYKELLDQGVITEEEFQTKKEQLLKLM